MGHSIEPDPRHDEWMGSALEQAHLSDGSGEVPIGAAVVHLRDERPGTVIAARHNERETTSDPTAHAEILALRDAAAALGRWRLQDCLLVVTLEPCPMCAGGLWASRIGGVVWGAPNDDAGSLGTLYNLGQDPRLNHEFPTRGGVRAPECAQLLRDFFASRR